MKTTTTVKPATKSATKSALEEKFRKGSVMRHIVAVASRKFMKRDVLVKIISDKMKVPVKTVQSEISYLSNPDDHRNNGRVRLDKRSSKGYIHIIAA
jgi:hypothetical protein